MSVLDEITSRGFTINWPPDKKGHCRFCGKTIKKNPKAVKVFGYDIQYDAGGHLSCAENFWKYWNQLHPMIQVEITPNPNNAVCNPMPLIRWVWN